MLLALKGHHLRVLHRRGDRRVRYEVVIDGWGSKVFGDLREAHEYVVEKGGGA